MVQVYFISYRIIDGDFKVNILNIARFINVKMYYISQEQKNIVSASAAGNRLLNNKKKYTDLSILVLHG